MIARNIRTINSLRTRAIRYRGLQDRIADVSTTFAGSMVFVYVRIAWFGGWILLT